jgi:tripartite ATP-independent transporter DctM subunit
MTLLFCLYILGRCLSDPQVGPAGPAFTIRQKLASLVNVLPIALIFIIVVGGIYVGLFTASEAAGVGAFAVLVVLLAMRRLTMARLLQASVQTARLSIMIMTVFIAVTLFSRFLVLTDVTTTLVTAITGSGLGRYAVLLLIVAMYIFLGMIMDGISTLVLTLPLVFPVITSLGFDAVWFGVLLTIIVEIGLITPPVGFNCYVLRSIATEVPLAEIFRGVAPFVVMSLAAIGLLIAFPQIALWLPSQLY